MSEQTVTANADTTIPSTGKVTYKKVRYTILKPFGLDKDTEMDELCKLVIGEILDEIDLKRRWKFNLIKAADITTVQGTKEYSIPSDLWGIYSTRKTDDIDYLISGMEQYTKDVIYNSQNNITGYPYVSTQFNIYRDGKIELFPIPDAAYTISLRYFRKNVKPTVDDNPLDMASPYVSMIQAGARSHFAAVVGKSTLMGYWESKYQERFADAKLSDEDVGDEDLKFRNADDVGGASYVNPNVRPHFLDFF